MQRVRSGTHLTQVGNVWYFLRAVPEDVRDVFGVTKVKISLGTSNYTEARRLEKPHDIEFDEKLQQARRIGPDNRPRDPAERLDAMVGEVLAANVEDGVEMDEALSEVPAADRAAVQQAVALLTGQYDQEQSALEGLLTDLRRIVQVRDDWDRVKPGIVAAVKSYCDGLKDEHSIRWALGQWKKAGNRPQQTIDEAERYINDFMEFTYLRALAGVRRSHLLSWRDELEHRGTPEASIPENRTARKLGAKTVNHWLEIVSAILRTGWRDAEMLSPDISKINLFEPESGRASWSKEHLLKALGLLEPGSGQAWVMVLNLTTSTRLGETVAVRKEWYHRLGFIEVPAPNTKKKKPHVMPIIDLIRPALERHLDTVEDGDYMFDVPRPTNPALKISHETSKWFSRLFHNRKHRIPCVIHELRDTWIEAARHNETVKKDIYEIITGHSAKTASDGYGGERPSVLMKANEEICKDLLDADLRAAILRLVE